MDIPRPGDPHKRLEALVGEWSGAETVHPAPWDPAGGEAVGEIVNSWILDGFAVMQQYAQIRNGTRNFAGHGVFWYDPAADEYGMTWWDTMGGSASHFRGRFDGDRLVLVSDMPQGGYCRSIFDVGTPGRYSFLMEVSPDGEHWAPAMEGTYEKSAGSRESAAGSREPGAGNRKPRARATSSAKPRRKTQPAAKTAAKKRPALKAPGRKKPAVKAPARRGAKKAAGRRR
ncbi:MAG: DUF1579 family protein [Acidobacteria bacterium]|nr:DUF1579 family protein [Acidobacteriota bacterium]